MIVSEFKNIRDLNDYLSTRKDKKIEIVPLNRTFMNPNTDMLTSTITYIVIEEN